MLKRGKKAGISALILSLILIGSVFVLWGMGRAGFSITGKVISGCSPDIECDWSECVNGKQQLICRDLTGCGLDLPQQDPIACVELAECIDNDNDGFGVGKGCLGTDPDDNNPNIMGSARPQVQEPEEGSEQKPLIPLVIILIFVGLLIIAIIVILIVVKGMKTSQSKQQRYREPVRRPMPVKEIKKEEKPIIQLKPILMNVILMKKGKEIVKQARSQGYDDRSITRMFKDKGWDDKQIKKVLEQ